MCCGVGNLEVKHSNYRNIFMSTLDIADINVMTASRMCVGANIFQYDYLMMISMTSAKLTTLGPIKFH